MNKILTAVLTVVLATSGGLLGKIGCQNMELTSRNAQLNKELMQADLEIGRAATRFGDAEKYSSELEGAIQDEIKTRGAHLTRIGKLQARLKSSRKGKGNAVVVKTVVGDVLMLPKGSELVDTGMLYQAISKNHLATIDNLSAGYTDYHLDITVTLNPYPNKELLIPASWDYTLDIKLRGVFAETITPSGAINNYLTLYEIDDKGKDVQKLELTQFDMIVEDQRKEQWFWWAPHIDVGALGGAKLAPPSPMFGGSIGFSIMGYGLTKNDLEWRVLRVSVDLTDGPPGIGLTPALYNIGLPIPLFSNLWIGPHITWLPPQGYGIGLFLGAVL